jgi:hypothetical protein
MPAGDDQGMPGRDWKPIPDDQAMLTCMDDALGWEGAKGAIVHTFIQPYQLTDTNNLANIIL